MSCRLVRIAGCRLPLLRPSSMSKCFRAPNHPDACRCMTSRSTGGACAWWSWGTGCCTWTRVRRRGVQARWSGSCVEPFQASKGQQCPHCWKIWGANCPARRPSPAACPLPVRRQCGAGGCALRFRWPVGRSGAERLEGAPAAECRPSHARALQHLSLGRRAQGFPRFAKQRNVHACAAAA